MQRDKHVFLGASYIHSPWYMLSEICYMDKKYYTEI